LSPSRRLADTFREDRTSAYTNVYGLRNNNCPDSVPALIREHNEGVRLLREAPVPISLSPSVLLFLVLNNVPPTHNRTTVLRIVHPIPFHYSRPYEPLRCSILIMNTVGSASFNIFIVDCSEAVTAFLPYISLDFYSISFRPYRCEVKGCGKRFAQYTALKTHDNVQ